MHEQTAQQKKDTDIPIVIRSVKDARTKLSWPPQRTVWNALLLNNYYFFRNVFSWLWTWGRGAYKLPFFGFERLVDLCLPCSLKHLIPVTANNSMHVEMQCCALVFQRDKKVLWLPPRTVASATGQTLPTTEALPEQCCRHREAHSDLSYHM